MSDILVGYAVMSRKPGGDWAKRTTFLAEVQAGTTEDVRMRKAREQADASLQQWSRIESEAVYKVVPWYYGDNHSWTDGTYSRKI